MNKKVLLVFIGILLGIVLSLLFAISATAMSKSASTKLGSPWDGHEKAWEQGTVVTQSGHVYVMRDENIPPHFYFDRLTRVYIHYEVDGYYFVEKYYDCFSSPIYGWIWHENILLDRNVVHPQDDGSDGG